MGTATSPCQGGPWPPLRVCPSTHLARGAEGLGEELDEGLVVVGGQHPVLHQPHRQPQGTQLPPATTRRGSARSCTHCSPSPVVGPPLGTATPGSCSCRVPGPAACTHPWSLAVPGKGRSWNQPLVGSVKMVSRGNSTWGDQRQGMNGVGAHARAPRAAPQHSSGVWMRHCPGLSGCTWILVGVDLWSLGRRARGGSEGVEVPTVLTRPKKSFLPTMSQSHTSTVNTSPPGSPSGSSNSSTSSQRGKRVFLITCWEQEAVALGDEVAEPLRSQHPLP